jgi:hypothetical protein
MQILGLDDTAALGAPMLEEIRRTAQRRLQQIEPLIEEAEQLRDVLKVIEKRSERGQSQRRPSARARSQGPRAAKGANKRVILELVRQRPGITPAEIASTTGMKRTVVASTVSRLKRHGELRDHEQGGVCLAGATATATSPARRRRASSVPSPSEHPRRLASLA